MSDDADFRALAREWGIEVNSGDLLSNTIASVREDERAQSATRTPTSPQDVPRPFAPRPEWITEEAIDQSRVEVDEAKARQVAEAMSGRLAEVLAHAEACDG